MREKAEYEIRLKDSQFNSGLKNTEKNMDHFEKKLKDIQNSIASAFAVGAIVAFGNEAFQTSTKLESLRNSIVFASGSAKEGAENLKFISDLSKEMGLNLMATTEGFRTFSGALIGSRFEGEQSREIFRKISTGIVTMGLSADDAKGAFLALGQMVSKGTVSAEELRGQLGERLPGAFQIAARSLGVTTGKLGDMLKQGEVITDDFLPKFADEIEKTFGGGVAKAAKGQQADLSKVENKWLSFKDIIGKGVAPIVHYLGQEQKTLTEQFFEQRDQVRMLDKDISPLVDRYKELRWKTNLTAGETVELKNITQTLAQALPGAALGWNAYGEAIGMSANSMDTLIAKNKDALKILNASAIAEKKAQLSSLQNRSETLQGILAAGSGKTNLTNMQNQLLRDAASELNGLTGTGGVIEKLMLEIEDLQGGGRYTDLLKGIKERDKMFAGLTPGSEPSSKTKKKGKKTSESGVEKISSGTRNITININKLVESVNISKTLDRMNNSEIVDAVKRTLLTAVNDANIVAQ